MDIPLLDLSIQYHHLREDLRTAMEHVLQHGHFILGEEVSRFEDNFAAFCGTEHCVGVASGTDALHLALRALGIGEGDEVITAANTFAATAFAITYTGAMPVFVDVDPVDYNIDVNLIEQAISSRTKAIIPVHLYGQPAEMDDILEIAGRHKLQIIEDACQAHGAQYKGQRVGSFGAAGCFSFYPGKNLGAYGDGGAIVTNDASLAERLRCLRNYAQKEKNVHTTVGFNSRLDTLQAAILLIKLDCLEEWNTARRRVARRYNELLAELPDVVVPKEKPGRRHVYHLYVIQHPQREQLLRHLRQHGIMCGIHYPHPLPQALPYQSAKCVPATAPISSRLAQQIVSLPMYPELEDQQVERVADETRCFIERLLAVS